MKSWYVWQPAIILLIGGCGAVQTDIPLGAGGAPVGADKGNALAARVDAPERDDGPLYPGTYRGTIHERIIRCYDGYGCMNWSDEDEIVTVTVGRDGSVIDGMGGGIKIGSEFSRQFNEFLVRCHVSDVFEIHNVLLFEIDSNYTSDDGDFQLSGPARLFLQAEGPDVLEYGYELRLEDDDTGDAVRIVRVGTLYAD